MTLHKEDKSKPTGKFATEQDGKDISDDNSHISVARSEAEIASATKNMNIEDLPDHLSEEELDEFLVQSGILDKLLAQIKRSKPSRDWQDELNEL